MTDESRKEGTCRLRIEVWLGGCWQVVFEETSGSADVDRHVGNYNAAKKCADEILAAIFAEIGNEASALDYS